jgi:isopenicillin N synthase-like dioxygenase
VTGIDSPELATRQRIAKELLDACSTCGFFYLKGHGLSEILQEETFDVMKRFFVLDLDSKMDAHVQKNPAIRGYEPIGETKIDPRTRGGKTDYPCKVEKYF